MNILTRTSVRRFADRPISRELAEAIVRAGMSAPSGVNRQPWEFVVVDRRELLDALAESLPYAKMLAHAPMAVCVCGNKARFLDGDDAKLWEQDLSAASENILLGAHALGLGAVWTCLYPHADRMAKAVELLHLPNGIIPFNIIPVGYPADGAEHPIDKWHPERVHFNRYDVSVDEEEGVGK